MLGKRGLHLIGEEIVFYILNAVFFIVLLVFIFNSVNGKPVYEQTYAKYIAFLIDQAKPGTEIVLDVSKLCEEYKIPLVKLDYANRKYSKPILDAFKVQEFIVEGVKTNKVVVKFGKMGSYGMPYFSNLKVEFDGIVEGENELGLAIVDRAIKTGKKIQDLIKEEPYSRIYKSPYCSQLKIKISK